MAIATLAEPYTLFIHPAHRSISHFLHLFLLHAQTMTGARNPDGTTDPFVMKLTPLELTPVTAQNTIICVQLQAPCPTIQVGWKGAWPVLGWMRRVWVATGQVPKDAPDTIIYGELQAPCPTIQVGWRGTWLVFGWMRRVWVVAGQVPEDAPGTIIYGKLQAPCPSIDVAASPGRPRAIGSAMSRSGSKQGLILPPACSTPPTCSTCLFRVHAASTSASSTLPPARHLPVTCPSIHAGGWIGWNKVPTTNHCICCLD